MDILKNICAILNFEYIEYITKIIKAYNLESIYNSMIVKYFSWITND